MELAKINTGGQITLPFAIKKKLNLKDGGKIAFIEDDGEYRIINPTKLVIMEAQKNFEGLSDELGLKTEDDVFELCREIRKDMWDNDIKRPEIISHLNFWDKYIS